MDFVPKTRIEVAVRADLVDQVIEAVIKAAKTGKVERILVKNGEAVEFGQKLFLVRP